MREKSHPRYCEMKARKAERDMRKTTRNPRQNTRIHPVTELESWGQESVDEKRRRVNYSGVIGLFEQDL